MTSLDAPLFALRPWSTNDAAALQIVLAANEAHLRAFTPWVIDGRVPGQSLEERLRRFAEAFDNGTEWSYAIVSPDGGEILGGCGLYKRVGPRALEIGYWLSAAHTGRGLATTATALLTRVAFSEHDIDRVELHCDACNVASVRIPQRLGFSIVAETSAEPDAFGVPNIRIWYLTRQAYIGQFDFER